MVLLGCNSSESDDAAYSQVGDDVEREGWVDIAHPLAGDGATSFESFPRSGTVGEYFAQPWRPSFVQEYGFDAGPLTAVVGGHLLSLSRYRGLVSTRLTGTDAPRVEAGVPLAGLPVGLVVSDGVAAVMVVDAQTPGCALGDCREGQTSRVVLVDVQDPARPRMLGEQRVAGTVFAARQIGSVLHVLSRQIVHCDCAWPPSTELSWLSFERGAPAELPAPRVTAMTGDGFFADAGLVVLSGHPEDNQADLRFADLSQPEPALSAPVLLAGSVRQAALSGGRLRVAYNPSPRDGDGNTERFDIEVFSLGSGAPVSLGRGTLAPPAGESLWGLTFDGERAFTLLHSGELALLDLSDPSAPRVASLLGLALSEGQLTVVGDRLLAVGRSMLPADAAPGDKIAYGPQALVLVDIADLAAPRSLDRVTLGSFDSVHEGAPELRGERALVTFYDAFPGAVNPGDACGRANRRLVGYDIASGTLAPAFNFETLDADARIETVGEDWWLASDVSVSRYVAGSGAAPAARANLTRYVDRLQPLSGSLALFGVDFATNAATFELASPAAALEAPPFDVALAVGLPRSGCDEQRRWSSPAAERDRNLYALRFHLPTNGGAPAAATLHTLPAPPSAEPLPGEPSPARSLELEPLAAGDHYLGAVQTERALLIARGVQLVPSDESSDTPRELSFSPYTRDPTGVGEFSGDFPWDADYGDDQRPGARLSYDVVDLSDPAAPVLASRLDIDPVLAESGFFRSLRGLTRDTAWGFQADRAGEGPSLVSGTLLAGSHSEPAANGRHRFYLDRFDFSEPRSPVALDPIEVPGSLLDFDAATGGLITLEALLFREPLDSVACTGVLPFPVQQRRFCVVQRHALNALVLDGDQATRVGRLLLDTPEREALRFAVSNGVVYYVTQPTGRTSEQLGPFAARDITLQRVALRDGRLERLPSFDIAASSNLSPKLWTHFAARGDRALWVVGGQLLVADFRSDEARLEVHELGPWNCDGLALQGDTAYCAQRQAGYVTIPLGEP